MIKIFKFTVLDIYYFFKSRLFCPLSKSKKIELMAFMIISGFTISYLYNQFNEPDLSLPYPYKTFLFGYSDRYMDFINVFNQMPNVNHPAFGIAWVYNPFTYVIVHFFTYFSVMSALKLFILIFVVAFQFFLFKELKDPSIVKSCMNCIVFSFLTYPFLFAIDRSNLEALVFIFLYLFIYAFRQGRYILSAVPLSLVIAMKPFPAVFLVLLLSERKYKATLYTVCLVILLSLSAGVFFGGFETVYTRWYEASKQFYQEYCIRNGGLPFGHSLWGGFKFLFGWFYHNLDPNVMAGYLKPYTVFCLLFFAFVAWFVVFRERVLWKRVALLVFCMNLLPYVSSDYKLLHIFIPLFLFVNCKKKEKTDVIYAIIFAFLLIPKAYYHPYLTALNPNDASISVLLNPISMLIMSLVIMWDISRGKSNDKSS